MNGDNRVLAFWILFTTGTSVLIWSVLFAQAPSPNHLPDLIQFSCSTVLLMTAGLIGLRKMRNPDTTMRPNTTMTVALLVLLAEMLFSVAGVWGSATHLHSL